MKKILFLSIFTLALLTGNSCSSGTEEVELKNDFTNADYVKVQMLGKWNYWGHKSPSCGDCWVYSGDVYKWYFIFKSDGTYECKSLSSEIQKGTYSISPATKEYNPILYLNYKEGAKDRTRKIVLRKLEGKSATIYESAFEERYDKE